MTADAAAERLTRRLPTPPVWLVLAVVGVAALGMRLAFLLRAPVFIIGDSENYFWPGYQLAREIGFDLELRRTPGYPLFIALVVRSVGEDLAALALVQHLLGVLLCLIVATLAVRYWGRWTGLLAGLLVGLSGPLLVAEQYVMAETLFIPLASVAVGWLALTLERPRWWSLFAGGLLIGAAALTRPVGLVLAVAVVLTVPVAVWLRQRASAPSSSLGRQVRAVMPPCVGLIAALIGGVALVWVPWMLRNAAVHGSFSAEGNAGQTLVGRAMRHDKGFAFENPSDPDPARQRAREIMRGGRGGFVSPVRDRIKRDLGLNDAEANRLMRDLALEAILRQPDYYLLGTVRWFAQLAQGSPERYRDHWQTRKDSGSREEWESFKDIRHLLGPPSPLQERQYGEAEVLISVFQSSRYGPLIPLLAAVGALGLALGVGARERRVGVALFLALVVVGLLAAAVAMVAPLPRYRYPIEPLLGLLAAGGAATVVGAARAAIGRTQAGGAGRRHTVSTDASPA
ncbi:MAG: glycosyltransferase family 39 protein [Chloroflexi bacterium]|nr:glycosyltransferase family 39 protein [Chloroflexota bacterium]